MFESIGRGFALVKTSWNILMDDKKLLLFPTISGIVMLFVLLTFILPLVLAGTFMNIPGIGPVFFYGLLFAFYIASYGVGIFFNTALITCVNARFQGREMSVGEGLSQCGTASPFHFPMGTCFCNGGCPPAHHTTAGRFYRKDYCSTGGWYLEPCYLLCCSCPHS